MTEPSAKLHITGEPCPYRDGNCWCKKPRTKEQIKKDYYHYSAAKDVNDWYQIAQSQRDGLLLEVLLDIRSILQDNKCEGNS